MGHSTARAPGWRALAVWAVAAAATAGAATTPDWVGDAVAEPDGYRVVDYEEKFENQGTEEGDQADCVWLCAQTKQTDWYVSEIGGYADVKYKPEGGEYAHVANEGGGGAVEVKDTVRLWVEYWPGVLPTDRIRSDGGTATGGSDTTLADTSKSWQTDEWAGGTVWIATETGAGQIRQISGNTATEVTVAQAWDTNPDDTSEYYLNGPDTGRYRDEGYIRVYCKRPEEYDQKCEPKAKFRKLWILDCNLESTRGGTPGNANDPASPSNGDGSVQHRAPYDASAERYVLPVALNDDDDDEDDAHKPDRDQIGPVSGEDDLVPLRFQFTEGLLALHNDPRQSDKGKVRIRVSGYAPEGSGEETVLRPRLKLWKSDTKGQGQEVALEDWIPIQQQQRAD